MRERLTSVRLLLLNDPAVRILAAARADATLASELGSATRDLQKTVDATGDVGAATATSVADAK